MSAGETVRVPSTVPAPERRNGANPWLAENGKVETPQYTDGLVRMIRSLGKRVARGDPSGMQDILRVEAELARAKRAAVEGLRSNGGYSDHDIAVELGVSRVAVWKRWPR